MLIYYFLYVLLMGEALLVSVTVSKRRQKTVSTVIMFFLIWIVLAFRHPSMGIDLGYWRGAGYLDSFSEISRTSWKQLLSPDYYLYYEKGYIIFNKLIGVISDNQQFFLAVIAAVSLIPVCCTVMKRSVNPLKSVIVYLGLPIFLVLFSALRQGIAVSLCFFSVIFIQDKKPIKYVLVVLFASLFHSSALFWLPAYFLYRVKLKKSVRFLLAIAFPAVYALKYVLFDILTRLAGYNVQPDYNNAITLFLILCMVYLFCVFFMDEEQDHGYLNLFFIACLIQALGGVYSVVLRVGYYYLFPLTLLLPKTLSNIPEKRARILVNGIVMLCFIYSGLSSLSDSSWALANPYHWFWENAFSW